MTYICKTNGTCDLNDPVRTILEKLGVVPRSILISCSNKKALVQIRAYDEELEKVKTCGEVEVVNNIDKVMDEHKELLDMNIDIDIHKKRSNGTYVWVRE